MAIEMRLTKELSRELCPYVAPVPVVGEQFGAMLHHSRGELHTACSTKCTTEDKQYIRAE